MANPIEILLIKLMEGAVALMRNKRGENKDKDALLLGQADGLYNPKQKENIYLSEKDRLRHTYILGATGSGKSKLLEWLIRGDIIEGRGFCLVDPHGDLFRNILNFIAGLLTAGNHEKTAQYISRKLVLIDPADKEWIVGFNPLETAGIDPFYLVTEFMGILVKLWQDANSGPRTWELLLNCLLTLTINNLTLLEAKRLLTDLVFRLRLLGRLPTGEAKEYWDRYNRLSERMQAVYREPILNRLSLFLSNPSLRLMVGQAKSSFNLRSIMDERKWLLINLSKGQLQGNALLLGSFLVAKLQLTALSRVDVRETRRTPFFMYVDEFQNFLGDDFETILSEARKYGLGLTIAHQNIDQLNRQLRSAILGNTLTQIFFRLSYQDANILALEFGQREKPMIQRRLTELGPRQAYLKIKGDRARLMRTNYLPGVKNNREAVQKLKALVMPNCARPRQEVEREIADRTARFSGDTRKRPPALQNDPDTGRFAPREGFQEGHGW